MMNSSNSNAPIYGENAVELIKELKRSKGLPRYNDALLRRIQNEIAVLDTQIRTSLAAEDFVVEDPAIACALVIHHQALLRNKRCALAYLNERLNTIKSTWWERAEMPDSMKANMGATEQKFVDNYDKLLGEYQLKMNIDLMADRKPPKDLYIEVRVLKDYGRIMTDMGEINLQKDTVHHLPRTDVELLVRQGVLEQTTSHH